MAVWLVVSGCVARDLRDFLCSTLRVPWRRGKGARTLGAACCALLLATYVLSLTYLCVAAHPHDRHLTGVVEHLVRVAVRAGVRAGAGARARARVRLVGVVAQRD